MRLRPVVVLPLLLALLVCAGGCGRRARLIPEGKLVRIYSDIFLADQWFRDNPQKRMAGDTSQVFDPIFRRYGYTFEDYDRSVHYYLDHPDKYNKLMTQVSERLRAAGEHLQAEDDAERAYESKLDSFRRLYKPKDFRVDSLRRPGPEIPWHDHVLDSYSLVLPVADSLAAPADSLTAPADTLAAVPDTVAADAPARRRIPDLEEAPRPRRDKTLDVDKVPVKMDSPETVKK